MTPIRIQRKRTKDWRMPENTVYVGRPTKWGNPFTLDGDMIFCDASHRRTILSPWVIFEEKLYDKEDGLKQIVKFYEQWINVILPSWNYVNHHVVKYCLFNSRIIEIALIGKNLACWCPLDQPCHVDVLLKLANK